MASSGFVQFLSTLGYLGVADQVALLCVFHHSPFFVLLVLHSKPKNPSITTEVFIGL